MKVCSHRVRLSYIYIREGCDACKEVEYGRDSTPGKGFRPIKLSDLVDLLAQGSFSTRVTFSTQVTFLNLIIILKLILNSVIIMTQASFLDLIIFLDLISMHPRRTRPLIGPS
jgi:hypothetical protein